MRAVRRLAQGLIARLSIRTRILLLMLVVIVPAGGALAWQLTSELRQARNAALSQVRVLAGSTAAQVLARLQQSESALLQVSRWPSLLHLRPPQCDKALADLAQINPEFDGLTLWDLDGRLLCHHSQSATPLSAEETRPMAAAHPGTDLSISAPFRRQAGQRATLVLSHTLLDATGQAMGVLCLAVDLEALQQEVLSVQPSGAVVVVTDAQQRLVMRSTQAEALLGPLGPGDQMPAHGLPSIDDVDADARALDGLPHLYASARLETLGWRVMAGAPRLEALAVHRETKLQALAIGAWVSVFALSLAVALSGTIARPIAQLRERAVRIASGDLETRATLDGPPEIRQLATAFNRMLDERQIATTRLQGIFDAALDAIITTDTTQLIVHANPAAARLLACPMDELLGSPIERFIPYRNRPGHANAVRAFGHRQSATRTMGRRSEVHALRADGRELPVEATITHMAIDGVEYYTVILRDLSPARQAEAELRASEANLRRLMMNLPEAVFVNRNGRISYVNQAAQELFGGTEVELLGRSPLELIDESSQALVRRRIAGLTRATPVSALAEVTIARLDGERRRVDTLGTLVEDNGDRSIIVVLRDTTPLRQAQAALQASHADLTRLLAELDRAQDDERRRISRELHDDMQQTLASIRMDASMLRDSDVTLSCSEAMAIGERIDELAAATIASTRRLINDLRPPALEAGFLPAIQRLAQAVSHRNSIVCEVHATAAARGSEPDENVALCLYRVAQEGLNNVIKHAQARQVFLGVDRLEDGSWQLNIHDDGRGMEATDPGKAGSFGLLGMRERLRALGGRLQIDSAPGQGTAITAWVPASDPAVGASDGIEAPEAPAPGDGAA